MIRSSLYRLAGLAARHFASDYAGVHGAQFSQDGSLLWSREHWWLWAADRVIEHIEGTAYYEELGGSAFASASAESQDRHERVREYESLRERLRTDVELSHAERERTLRELGRIVNELLD